MTILRRIRLSILFVTVRGEILPSRRAISALGMRPSSFKSAMIALSIWSSLCISFANGYRIS
jgi:hypothetical protein